MRVSRVPVQLLAAFLLPGASAFQMSEPVRNYQGVTLRVSVPSVVSFVRGIPCIITLSNSGGIIARSQPLRRLD
jgi:hypothetical protein